MILVFRSGGLYASGADFRATGLSILNSELLSPAATQEWLKPRGGTGSLVELVGAPWEIARLMIPVTPGSNRTRLCDVYLKAGGNIDYNAVFGISPDHGIGFSILVAGTTSSPSRWLIRDAVAETFVIAAEHAAVENAKMKLAGTFVHEQMPNTNLTLTVDDGKPGIGLDSLYVEGVESRATLFIGVTDPIPVSTRLYPNGINSHSRSLASLYRRQGTMEVRHRMIAEPLPLAPRSITEGGVGSLFDRSLVWMLPDFDSTKDEFIFELVDGKLMSVTNTGLNMTFNRVD